MTDGEIEAKFQTISSVVLVPARQDLFLERAWELDEAGSIDALLSALVVAPEPAHKVEL